MAKSFLPVRGGSSSIYAENNQNMDEASAAALKPYKPAIDSFINQAKDVLSEEKDNLKDLISKVSKIPGGAEREQANKQYIARKVGFDKTNHMINRINAFNIHKMYPEMAKEFVKLHDAVNQLSVKQNPITDIFGTQPAYGDTLSHQARTSQSVHSHSKFINGKYNRSAATGYAASPKYVTPSIDIGDINISLFGNYNHAYHKYNNGDCANFVSQALKAGGVMPTNNWHYNTQTGKHTYSWSMVKDQLSYLEKNGYINGKPIPIHSINDMINAVKMYKVHPGDLLYQSSSNSVKDVHHAMMITKIEKNGLIKYSAHTSDRVNEEVTSDTFKSDRKPQTLFIVRMKGQI